MWCQLSTTCSNLVKYPNAELLVAVDHNQLRTMASETVDPIDWPHTALSLTVRPERLMHSVNRCSLCSTGNRSCNFSMRDNHLAYSVTQDGCLCGCYAATLTITICEIFVMTVWWRTLTITIDVICYQSAALCSDYDT